MTLPSCSHKARKAAEPPWFYSAGRKDIFVGRDVDLQDSSLGKYGSVMRTDTEHRYGESLGHIQKEKSFRKTKPTPLRSMSEPGIRAVGSEKWTLVTPVPHLKCHCYTHRISAPILSKEEIQAVEREKKDLQYQMLTLDTRVMWNLKWKMDVYLPGYKKRVAAVSTSAAPTPVQMTAPRTASRINVFERLSTPGRRSPSPCHAAVCNAFKRG
ncbi:uncharacterized protein LOC122457996 [Dermochelys coriacea]|uniref:uncharacterized protein LOC122457996 n=1 Tax=Dermochelys coriacea TaxID=27794 RepID=UPI001CA8DB85|nr:uncharacterized protein LOC122457996 [Dermochelys coriacea]